MPVSHVYIYGLYKLLNINLNMIDKKHVKTYTMNLKILVK